MSYAMRYFSALIVLVALDALWLSYFARAVFRPTLGDILLDTPRWGAASLFYVLYALGIVLFAVMPALRNGSWQSAALMGAMFGFFAYMTYDLTNFATLKAWTLPLALADIAWGTVASGLAATASYVAGNLLGLR